MNRKLFTAIVAAVCLCGILFLAGVKVFAPEPVYDFDPDREVQQPAEMVYIAGAGTKFHRENCGSVTAAEDVKKMPREEAEAAGYEACQRCAP